MKKISFYSFILGALIISSCSNDSISEQPSGNGEELPTVSKITSVFSNGTNMSVGNNQSNTRGGGTLTVGEEETLCAKYDVAAGFQSNGTVPYIKVSVHVYEECASECEKLRLTFKGVEDLVCKTDDFAFVPQTELILTVALVLIMKAIESTNINTATCRFPVILISLSVVLTTFMKVISRVVTKNL